MADTAVVIAGGQYSILPVDIQQVRPRDVRKNIIYGSYDQYTGDLDLPAESDVKAGVTFDGDTRTGTYAGGGSGGLLVPLGMNGGING